MPEHLGAFTDRPPGERPPGEEWKHPSEIIGTRWEDYTKKEPFEPAWPMPKPPTDFKVPDYRDRERFEKKVFDEIGGNPFDINPTEEVEKATRENAEGLFRKVFQGQRLYSDIERLDPKERRHWDSQLNKYRAWVYNQAVARQKELGTKHKWMMTKWDNAAAEKETRIKEYREKERTWLLKREELREKAQPIPPKELERSQVLDDWRGDYKTRLDQLKDDYGDFNTLTGLWSPRKETYEEYKKKRQKLINEYEEGTKDILKGKIPKRMSGALVGKRKEEDYVGKFIGELTKGY